jgi:adenine-specific DNA-methyltransferase
VRTRPSAFNRRGQHAAALTDVLDGLRVRYLVVSFSDEGFLSLDELRAMLAERGRVREAAVANPRYIGHKIGIHDLRGRKVGTPGPARNREHLFVVELGVAPARRVTSRIGGKCVASPRALKVAAV